jgi:hypothetical protein
MYTVTFIFPEKSRVKNDQQQNGCNAANIFLLLFNEISTCEKGYFLQASEYPCL